MSTALNPNGHTSPWDAGTWAMLSALMQSQMAQSEAMLRTLMQEQATRFQPQPAQHEMLLKTVLQAQATQNEMLWKALLERSATRGPSVFEILRELKSLLPDRTNDILTGIEIGKSLMAHRAPAAPRDDVGALLRGVVEAIGQAPGRKPPQPRPVQRSAFSEAELRVAVSDPAKWQHIRTLLAMKFSRRPQPTSPEEVQFRALLADPPTWERLRVAIVASHAPQQPAAVQAASNTTPQPVSTAGIPPEPAPAEIRAAISDPAKWAQIRTVFAIRFSQQPPATPKEASICAAAADPVAWESVRTIMVANHAPQQPAVVSQAAPSTPPQSATTAATDVVPEPGTVDHAPQPHATVPQPVQNTTQQSVEIAGAAPAANRSPDTANPSAQRTHSPPSRGGPARTHRRPQRRNSVRNPAARRLTVRAPPQTTADHKRIGHPILCLLTAERREPVLFGGRPLPTGFG